LATFVQKWADSAAVGTANFDQLISEVVAGEVDTPAWKKQSCFAHWGVSYVPKVLKVMHVRTGSKKSYIKMY